MLRSHQLDKKPIDLHAVIHESLALVAHDMSARQVEATVNLSSNPCVITGDQVLLQQVLVNLVMNAMDAMAETPPARRRVTISTEVRAADVEVSVRDTGTGLPAHIDGTLFTPFVTTKAHGLGIGLTIVADDRRRAWWHHRRPQQSRRGRDIHGHPAPQRIGGGRDRRTRRSGHEPLTSLFCAAPIGIRTSTFVPSPGRESTLTLPCMNRTRS